MYEAFHLPARGVKNLRKKIFSFISNPNNKGHFVTDQKAFTRNRVLGFKQTTLMILHLFKESVSFNLVQILPQLGCKPVTESAFTQARYKIKWEFFKGLTQQLYPYYVNSSRKLWKGMTVVGIDGSVIHLRNTAEIRQEFGVFTLKSSKTNHILARVMFYYDVLNNYVLGGTLSPLSQGEQFLAEQYPKDHIFPQKNVCLYDRGFGSRQFIQNLIEKGENFCVRMPISAKIISSFVNGPDKDWIGDWDITKGNLQKAKVNGRPISIFKIRLIKIALPNGEVEVLATNLFNQDKFTLVDMGILYRSRWGVEEAFKKLKAFLKIEQFGCGKVAGIYQEFYAHLFYFNLIGIIGIEAQRRIDEKCKYRKYPYQYNWKNAFRFLRYYIIELLSGFERRDRLLEHIIVLITNSRTAIVPNRVFKRGTSTVGRSLVFYK